MKKINVLILTHSLHIGGAEKHIYSMISKIDKIEFNFIIICFFEPGVIGELLSKKGFNVYSRLMKSNLDLSGLWKIIRIAKQEKFDILYTVLTPLTLFWGVLCSRLAGIAKVITRSTTIYPLYHITRKRKMLMLFSLFFVDRIIAQSYSHRDYLIESAGFDSENIVVLYNGVDLEYFSGNINTLEMRKVLGIPLDCAVVGIVGRLVPEKGISVLLNAAKLVIKSLPHVRFLIVGDGKERKDLEDASRKLNIEDNVHFLGMRDDILEVVSSFDVAVMSSVTEAFSNAILEYMAVSRPVVVTDAGSNAEIVNDNTGCIVPVGDHEAMANALLGLLKEKVLAKKMGRAGRKRVEEKFSLQNMIRQYEILFRNTVDLR
jgi:glycosyltransferase involved in cell wall biosynthesis